MDLSVPYQQVNSAEEAYLKIKQHITPEYIQKWGVSGEMSYDEAAKTICSKGKGFELKMEFKENECHVQLELAFFLKALKGKVLEYVEKELKKGV